MIRANRAVTMGLACAVFFVGGVAGRFVWAQTAPATAPDATEPAASRPGALAGQKVDLTKWLITKNGCDVDQDGEKIHIAGTNSTDGWANHNAVTTRGTYPLQDFEVSTDFQVSKLQGSGKATVILRAQEADLSQVTLQYYAEGHCYVVRWWTNHGEAFAQTQLKEFGDEATKVHHMLLRYDATTHDATGYVDDKKVGTVNFEFKGDLQFVMGVSTDKKGYAMDVTFDHPAAVLTKAPADAELP